MKVLLVCYGESSHAAGMVPLGWALRCAGHDVRFATQPGLTEYIAESGLTVNTIGRDNRLTQLLRRVSPIRGISPDPGATDDEESTFQTWSPDQLHEWFRTSVPWWWQMVNEPMFADLIELSQQWRPDLVVWETVSFAGSVAAEIINVPHVRFVWSVDLLGLMRQRYLEQLSRAPYRLDPIAGWLGDRLARFDVSFNETMVTGMATLTQFPHTLQSVGGRFPTDRHTMTMRHVAYNGAAPAPRWLFDTPPRPRVAVCLGTSSWETFGRYLASLPEILDGLASLDVEVVCIAGADTLTGLQQQRWPNVRFESFLPLAWLLPTCVVFVNHGGPGTLGTAMTMGVPQVIISERFDSPMLAEALAVSGAGVALAPATADAEAVRAAVATVLGDYPRFRQRAQDLAGENDAGSSPAEVVTQLEDMVKAHRLAGMAS